MEDVPMRRYTSMKTGGRVPFLIYPCDEQDLLSAVAALKDRGIPYRFLGNGTNVIVHDQGLREAIIRLTQISRLRYRKVDEGVLAQVSAGMSLRRFIKECEKRGLAGLERLFSIPGTIGGAIKMNAGSFGLSVSERLKELRILDREGLITEPPRERVWFGYRSSFVREGVCVLGAVFLLKEEDRAKIRQQMEMVLKERRDRHPVGFPTAGSVFKNVGDTPAWKLIEKAGLRGLRIGDACISEKHANFIINLGSASAWDIKRLVETIKREVFEKTGIMLQEEIEFWGFDE
jgi:UDP-N-acetylmuramate dehydrogenase